MPAWQFAPVPAALADAVRAEVPTLLRTVIAAVGLESPVYAAVLDGPEGVGIRLGIEQAVVAFIDGAELGTHPSSEAGELWRRLGESEFQAGRELELLRSAFRTGTRALWRETAHVAAAANAGTDLVVALAEAIFVYTDELAADVVEGYMRAQTDEAGELERRRRRVATLLMDPGGVDSEALARAAALARWTLPRDLAVVALAGQSPVAITRYLGVDALVGADADGVFVILPDPSGPGRRAVIERGLADELCALGPVVGVADALRSLRWARWLLDLADRGVLGGGSTVGTPASGAGGAAGDHRSGGGTARGLAVDDHLVELVALRDPELAAALVQAALGPLDQLADAERTRLEDTLAAWLAHQRHTPAVAEELHVHPQTVRYRVHRLRELLGEGIDTPEGRLELELALLIRRASAL